MANHEKIPAAQAKKRKEGIMFLTKPKSLQKEMTDFLRKELNCELVRYRSHDEGAIIYASRGFPSGLFQVRFTVFPDLNNGLDWELEIMVDGDGWYYDTSLIHDMKDFKRAIYKAITSGAVSLAKEERRLSDAMVLTQTKMALVNDKINTMAQLGWRV